MTDTLPPPLVPAEVDLRDFGFMPLDVRTLLSSTLWIKAKKDPRVAHAAVSLWCEAWHQVPAGSLPDDDEVLADLARCDEKEWKRIRERALGQFVKCSDGLLYHTLVAEKALAAWKEKLAQRARTKAATEARAASRRERDAPRDVPRDDQRDASRDVHQGTGTGRGIEKEEQGAQPGATTSRALVEGEVDPSPPDEGAGTRYGLAARAMRLKGCPANPGDPRLRNLVDQGASVEELEAVAAEAAEKGKGPPWALAALVNRRAEAAATQLAQTPAQDWRESREAVSARGQALGLGAWQDFEAESIRRGKVPSYPAYRQRVIDAAGVPA